MYGCLYYFTEDGAHTSQWVYNDFIGGVYGQNDKDLFVSWHILALLGITGRLLHMLKVRPYKIQGCFYIETLYWMQIVFIVWESYLSSNLSYLVLPSLSHHVFWWVITNFWSCITIQNFIPQLYCIIMQITPLTRTAKMLRNWHGKILNFLPRELTPIKVPHCSVGC